MDLETPKHAVFQPLAAWARLLTWGAVASGVWAAIRNPPDGFSSSIIAAAVLSLGILGELVFGGVKIDQEDDPVRDHPADRAGDLQPVAGVRGLGCARLR